MRGIVLGVAVLLSAAGLQATAGKILSYTFDPPLLEIIWCQCQISSSKTPVNLWRDPHDNFTGVTITVNKSVVSAS